MTVACFVYELTNNPTSSGSVSRFCQTKDKWWTAYCCPELTSRYLILLPTESFCLGVQGLQWNMSMQGEELTDRFLRILTDLAVSHCLTGETSSMTMRPGLLYFVAVDAYVRLLTMLITGFFHCPLLVAPRMHCWTSEWCRQFAAIGAQIVLCIVRALVLCCCAHMPCKGTNQASAAQTCHGNMTGSTCTNQPCNKTMVSRPAY